MKGIPSLKNNQALSKRGGARPGAGRKSGIPNKATAEVRDLAQKHTAAAIKALADIAKAGESEAARVSAANSILDRAYGRPTQAVSVGGVDGAPIRHAHELSDEMLAQIAASAK